MMEGVNPIKIKFKHICKGHTVFPIQLLYPNNKGEKECFLCFSFYVQIYIR
jgi:hypothetical protein